MNKPSPEVPNQQLHEYVTSGVFTMVLHKSHIALLEHVYLFQNRTMMEASITGHGSPLLRRTWVPASHSLQSRGLILHRPEDGMLSNGTKLRDVYKLTKAGQLMIELLKEAGLLDPGLKRLKADRKNKASANR